MTIQIEPGVTVGPGIIFAPVPILQPKTSHTVTAYGNARVSTTQVKFGTGSYTSNIQAGYLSVTPLTDLAFGTGDFTIEMWYYPTSVAGDCTLYGMRPSGGQGAYPTIAVLSGGAVLYYTNITNRITASALLTTNTWGSVAICRNSGNTKMYINGTQTGVTYADTNNYLAGSCVIGSNDFSPGSFPVKGFVDEIRISNIARYTGNYTPATGPFIPDNNTLVLIHCDGTANSTVFTDSSNSL